MPGDGPIEARRKIDVVFATPTLSHSVAVEFLNSVIETDRLCLVHGIAAAWLQIGGDPYLAKVRNQLMTRFLEDFPDAHTLFFLDDDIGWPARKAVEIILRGEPVIAGLYPKKQDRLQFPGQIAINADTGGLIGDGGLAISATVPTGFMRIRREVLETLAKTARRFKEDHVKGREYIEFCTMGLDSLNSDGLWIGEDIDLSRRIVAAGYNLWIDPDIEFTHRGSKIWRDRFATHADRVSEVIVTIEARIAKEKAA